MSTSDSAVAKDNNELRARRKLRCHMPRCRKTTNTNGDGCRRRRTTPAAMTARALAPARLLLLALARRPLAESPPVGHSARAARHSADVRLLEASPAATHDLATPRTCAQPRSCTLCRAALAALSFGASKASWFNMTCASRFGPSRATFDRSWATIDYTTGPIFARGAQSMWKLCRCWPKPGQIRPNLGPIRSTSPEVGRFRPQLGQIRAEMGRHRPSPANIAQTKVGLKLAQIRPKVAESGRVRAEFGRNREALVESEQIWPKWRPAESRRDRSKYPNLSHNRAKSGHRPSSRRPRPRGGHKSKCQCNLLSRRPERMILRHAA